MLPESRLTDSVNNVRFPITNDADSIPVNLLLVNASCSNVFCICSDVGMDPVRKLFDTSILSKDDIEPISPRDPCSPLPDKCRV